MDAALSIVANKVAEWGTARAEHVVAGGNMDLATIGQAINSQLTSKLCVS